MFLNMSANWFKGHIGILYFQYNTLISSVQWVGGDIGIINISTCTSIYSL